MAEERLQQLIRRMRELTKSVARRNAKIHKRTRSITAEEFEWAYADRSMVTVEWLRQRRTVRPCNCGEEGCEGWQMVSHEAAAEIDDPEKPWAR